MRPPGILKTCATVMELRKLGRAQRHMRRLIKVHRGGFDLDCKLRKHSTFGSQNLLPTYFSL